MRRLALPFLLLAATGGCHKQEAAQPQAQARPVAPAAETSKAVTTSAGHAMPAAPFTDLATGAETKLEAFKGKPVLVNLWATWCVPCVRELPTLDRLARDQAGKLTVLTISEDLDGARVVKPFLAGRKVTLHPYHDPNNALMTQLKEAGLPLTILYSADGKEVWRVPGDMDWTGAQAKALLAQVGV